MGRALPDSDDDTYSSSDSTQNGSEDDIAYETDATVDSDIDSDIDSDVDDEENGYGIKAKDCAWLLADNEHPPEYYIRQMKHLDESEYAKQDYSVGSTILLDGIEEQWNQYVIL